MKDKIIDASVELLNKNGINQTSFRTIASALQISDGHVRYYFKTKEDLLLAIFKKLDEEMLAIAEFEGKTTPITQSLKEKLKHAYLTMINYRFLFEESPNTLNQYPLLTAAYSNLLKERKSLFFNLFQELISNNYFNKNFTPEIQEMAFFNLFIISDSWIRYYTILNNKEPDEEAIDFHCNLVFSILIPYIKTD